MFHQMYRSMHYTQTDNAHETCNAMIFYFYFLISLHFKLSIDFVTSDCTPKVNSRRVEILLIVYAFVLLFSFYAYFLFSYNALTCIHDVTFLLALNNCLKFDGSPRPGNMTCRANKVMNRCLL